MSTLSLTFTSAPTLVTGNTLAGWNNLLGTSYTSISIGSSSSSISNNQINLTGTSQQTIKANCLNGNSQLQSISDGSSVIAVGSGAFENCSALSNINLPAVVTIADHAFANNTSTVMVLNIPNAINIDSTSFSNITAFTNNNITIGNAGSVSTPIIYWNNNVPISVFHLGSLGLEGQTGSAGASVTPVYTVGTATASISLATSAQAGSSLDVTINTVNVQAGVKITWDAEAVGQSGYLYTASSNPNVSTFSINIPNNIPAQTSVSLVITLSTSPVVSANASFTVTAASVPPTNLVPPTITGTPASGQILTVSTGTWSGTVPITYSYAWYRKTNTISFAEINGATTNSYTVTGADAGTSIYAAVTASNGINNGNQTASSNTVSISTGTNIPANTSAPAISGTTTVNQVLTVSNGTWTGTSPITYTYQWKRSGVNISGATSATYVLQSIDAGNTLTCIVTATNSAGAVSANSNNTSTITSSGTIPVNTVAPAISGTTTVNQTLSVTNGTWTGTTPFTYTYQWYRSSAAISGATNSTYVLQILDVNNPITCIVTATNSAGSASASSNITSSVTQAVVTSTPTTSLSGTTVVYDYGTQLTAIASALTAISSILASMQSNISTIAANSNAINNNIATITNNSTTMSNLASTTGIHTIGAYDWLGYASLYHLYVEQGGINTTGNVSAANQVSALALLETYLSKIKSLPTTF